MIPKGYSNDPADLEHIMDHQLEKAYGPNFQGHKPVLVRFDNGCVIWHVFEARGRYYMRHGRFGYLRPIDEPDTWANLGEAECLEGLRKELVKRLDGLICGWVDTMVS